MIKVGAISAALLIVDDNVALSQLLAWEFQDLGCTVSKVADCRQATALARTMEFDFALVDCHLPDGDGRSLSQCLKQLLPRLHIVMMSADRARATPGKKDIAPVAAFVDKSVPTARIHHIFSVRAAAARWIPCRTE